MKEVLDTQVVKVAMQLKGLSIADLAEETDVSVQLLQQYISGTQSPSLAVFAKICAVLEVGDARDLLFKSKRRSDKQKKSNLADTQQEVRPSSLVNLLTEIDKIGGKSPAITKEQTFSEEPTTSKRAAEVKVNRALTSRQAEVLQHIIACIEKEQRAPTIREIGAEFGFRSTGSVRDIIAALIKKGELVKDAAVSRGTRLNPDKYEVKVIKES